jgi:hypothetical protein
VINSKRYLLVRPLGGLNDCLCQINYAKRIAFFHRRKLVIQTETGDANLFHRFGQSFESIFKVEANLNYLDVDNFINQVSK